MPSLLFLCLLARSQEHSYTGMELSRLCFSQLPNQSLTKYSTWIFSSNYFHAPLPPVETLLGLAIKYTTIFGMFIWNGGYIEKRQSAKNHKLAHILISTMDFLAHFVFYE